MLGCKSVDLRGSPWCGDMPLMNKQSCFKAFLPYMQRSVIISTKDGYADIQIRGNIPGKGQGLASIFFISSSFGLNRPCRASMTGLAI